MATAPTNNGVLGMALYLEFRRDSSTTQYVLTPQVANPLTGLTVPVTLLSRQLSATNPRRKWRFRVASTIPDGSRTPLEMPAAVEVAAGALDVFTNYLNGMHIGGWTLHQDKPLAVEFTVTDLADIADCRTPDALNRRIMNARTEAGFDSSLWKLDTMPVSPVSF